MCGTSSAISFKDPLGPLEPQLQLLELGTQVDRPGVADLGIEIFQNIPPLKY